jgi:hypothetical protein
MIHPKTMKISGWWGNAAKKPGRIIHKHLDGHGQHKNML